MKKLLLALSLLLMASCGTMTADAAPINDACPFAGEAVDANSPSVMVGDHKVAFCCKKCSSKFAKMSAEEQQQHVDKILAKN